MAFDQLLSEGNEMFDLGRWPEAIDKYGEYIALLANYSGNEDLKFRRVRVHSNRAGVYLKLKNYLAALDDSERALRMDKTHFKSWIRMISAFDGLGLYQEEVRSIKQLPHAITLTDRGKSWAEAALQSAERKDRQTRFGDIEPEMNRKWENQQPGPQLLASAPNLEEYVGPIRIGRTQTMGRGLFATRDIQQGELLLVSNALTSSRSAIKCEVMPVKNWIYKVLQSLEEIVKEAEHNIENFSQFQRLVQLDTLGGPYSEDQLDRDVPPMRYFIPINALPEESWGVTEKDMKHPALKNCFTREFLMGIVKDKQLSRHNATLFTISELYVLPSLMNHSCLPNVSVVALYNQKASKVFRASRFIRDGEELFRAYHNIFCPVDERRILYAENYCQCLRCTRELQLNREVPLLGFMGSECKNVDTMTHHTDLSEWPLENLARLRMSCMTGITAVNSLSSTLPKLENLSWEGQHWLRAALIVRFLRPLLHPSMQKLPSLSEEHNFLPMVIKAVQSMLVVDPASELALSICCKTAMISARISNRGTNPDSEMEQGEQFLLDCATRIIDLLYGSGVSHETAWKILKSYEERLSDFPF
ncbi:hypothetical protein R1flu_001875 [Riccia fluitans]|uniref:SET domain-containing protein n=1 Tax=Riccia fluitans TaxID=41844 RepID=A0ABD1Y4P1_9MARC